MNNIAGNVSGQLVSSHSADSARIKYDQTISITNAHLFSAGEIVELRALAPQTVNHVRTKSI